jgi:hypothetical protein
LQKTPQPSANSAQFRKLFLNFFLPLLDRNSTETKEQLKGIVESIEKNQTDVFALMADRRCSPINAFDYTVQLFGKHALD